MARGLQGDGKHRPYPPAIVPTHFSYNACVRVFDMLFSM